MANHTGLRPTLALDGRDDLDLAVTLVRLEAPRKHIDNTREGDRA